MEILTMFMGLKIQYHKDINSPQIMLGMQCNSN